jgi:hypothetical protein
MVSAKSPNAAQLLPVFDPWVIGASRRAAAPLEPEYKARIYRGQGRISPVLLVNGRMVGVWRHARRGRRLLVEIEPLTRLPDWARAQGGHDRPQRGPASAGVPGARLGTRP